MSIHPPSQGLVMSEREKRFVIEMLIDNNQTQAAIRAGYSARQAKSIGAELMRRPRVKKAMAAARAEQRERTLITADQVLLDIMAIGDKALKDKDYAQALRSRELLGKRYKLFTDRMEVLDTTPRAERLRQARERKKRENE